MSTRRKATLLSHRFRSTYQFCSTVSPSLIMPFSVFATRITTSKPYFNRKGGYWIWRRYAVNTAPKLPNYAPDKFSSVRIPWPKINAVTRPERTYSRLNQTTSDSPSASECI